MNLLLTIRAKAVIIPLSPVFIWFNACILLCVSGDLN